MTQKEFQEKYGGTRQQTVMKAVDSLSRPFLYAIGKVTKDASEYFSTMIDNSSLEDLEEKSDGFSQEVIDYVVQKYSLITENYSNAVATKIMEYDNSFDDFDKYRRTFDPVRMTIPETNVEIGEYTAGNFLRGARNVFITAGVTISLVHIAGIVLESYSSAGLLAKFGGVMKGSTLVNPLVAVAVVGACAYYGHKEAVKKATQDTRANFKKNLKTILSAVEDSLYCSTFDSPLPYFEEFLKNSKASVVLILNEVYKNHLSMLDAAPATDNDIIY